MKPVEAAEGDTEMRRKLTERHNIAVRLLELRVKDYRRGITPLSPVFEAARTVADAKLDLAANDEERAKTVQQVVEVSKVIEQTLEKQVQVGLRLGGGPRARPARAGHRRGGTLEAQGARAAGATRRQQQVVMSSKSAAQRAGGRECDL